MHVHVVSLAKHVSQSKFHVAYDHNLFCCLDLGTFINFFVRNCFNKMYHNLSIIMEHGINNIES